MAGMRDDSAGTYGQWTNPQDQSWLDYLKMKGSDVGGGAYNALANITGALSPVGTSEQGNMSLQVPPMVTGLVDSAKRIGQRGGFTRVPELDEQLKQDLSNVVLSLYGGNALAGLAKPKAIPHSMSYAEQWSATPAADRSMLHPGMEAGIRKLMGHGEYSTSPQVRDRAHGLADNIKQYEAEIAKDPTNAEVYTPLIQDAYRAIQLYADDAATDGILKSRGVSDNAIATGKRLLSDNKPSILGSALATAGEQPKGITAYHGAEKAGYLEEAQRRGILWGSDSPSVSSNYAFDPQYADTTPKYIGNDVWTNGPELYDRHVRDAESNGGSVAPSVTPLEFNFQNPLVAGDPKNSAAFSRVPYQGAEWYSDDLAKYAREKGHDGLIMQNVWDGGPPSTIYAALQRGTVKSPMTGETLFSRGVPLPPQQQDDNLPDWLKY